MTQTAELSTQLEKISEEISGIVTVDAPRYRQCLEASRLERTKREADQQVLEMKREVQGAKEALTLASAQCSAAVSEQQEAKEKVNFFRQHVLGTEQVSINKMREDLETLKVKLNTVLAEIGVMRSLNEEIRWRGH